MNNVAHKKFNQAASQDHFRRRLRVAWLAVLVWTILIGLSLLWNYYNEHGRVIELAKAEARANLSKDKAFRLWATAKGGFYIPVGEHTQPSPYLANLPFRDVTTTSGKVMTLFNPATAIKEIGEQFQELSGIQAKITHMVYLNPENAPDAWEIAALKRFEHGASEIAEVVAIGDREFLRMAHPMKLEQGCLKCHAGTAGGLGGSTGVAIPLDPYRLLAHGAVVNLAQTHAAIWSVGLGLIGFMSRLDRKYETGRAATEKELRKLSRAVEASASAIMIMNENFEIQFVNEKFCEVTGYRAEDVTGKSSDILKSSGADQEHHHRILNIVKNGKEWKGEIKNRKSDGMEIWCLESLSGIADESGQVTHYVTVIEDISARKMSEDTIMQLAYFDPLTDLPNRRHFYERLEQVIAQCRRTGSQMALFYLDLDQFKGVNDTFGHGAGDALLKIMAQRLSSCLMRETDLVARLGGDEFAIIIPDTNRTAAAAVAEKLNRSAREQIVIAGNQLHITVSVGISIFPKDTGNLDQLVKFADIALYEAKAQGKDRFRFYS